jgi:replication factor C small subunit
MEENHAIWIEKYRPRVLEDIIGQQEIIERLRSYVAKREMPHLLFTGNAGTGKTTAAVALAREFFGDDWQMNFRELNALIERALMSSGTRSNNLPGLLRLAAQPLRYSFSMKQMH